MVKSPQELRPPKSSLISSDMFGTFRGCVQSMCCVLRSTSHTHTAPHLHIRHRSALGAQIKLANGSITLMGDRSGGVPAPWAREKEFMRKIDEVLERATESRLKAMAEMAVTDERSCYKVAVKSLERANKKAGGDAAGRLNLLFACSEVLRQSHGKYGKHGKYGERFVPLLNSLLEMLADTDRQVRTGGRVHERCM